MASRFSDPDWWPAPPPQRPVPVSKIIVGTLIPGLAVVGAVVVFLTGRGGHAATTPVPAPAVTASSPATRSDADRRTAFAECLRSAGGGGGGGSVRGRFGRSGPSEQTRRALDVCRSLLQPDAAPLTPPAAAAKPGTAPVA